MQNTDSEKIDKDYFPNYSRIVINFKLGEKYHQGSFVLNFNNVYATTIALIKLIELGDERGKDKLGFVFRYAYKDFEEVLRIVVEYDVKDKEDVEEVLAFLRDLSDRVLTIVPPTPEILAVMEEQYKWVYSETMGAPFIRFRVALKADIERKDFYDAYSTLLGKLTTYLDEKKGYPVIIPYMTRNDLSLDPTVLAPTNIVDYDYDDGTYFIGVTFKATTPTMLGEMKALFKSFLDVIGKPPGGLQ